MKTKILVITTALAMTSALAQDLTSKKGEPILPESGDWSIGIDATPVLNYFGNFLSSGGNTAPTWGYQTNQPLTITGKYFADTKMAYRAMVRIGFGSTTTNGYVKQDGQNDPSVIVKDTKKDSYHNITLGAGLEKRRGKTRLQGFYGGMLMFGLGSSKTEYTYGNAFSSTNQNPTRTNFGTNNPSLGVWNTEEKNGSTFMLALRGFIGAEYFIFPKVAVGAEFGWGVGLKSTGDGSTTQEWWDSTKNSVALSTFKWGGRSTFGLDTDINNEQMMPTGILTLNLHF